MSTVITEALKKILIHECDCIIHPDGSRTYRHKGKPIMRVPADIAIKLTHKQDGSVEIVATQVLEIFNHAHPTS